MSRQAYLRFQEMPRQVYLREDFYGMSNCMMRVYANDTAHGQWHCKPMLVNDNGTQKEATDCDSCRTQLHQFYKVATVCIVSHTL